MSFPRVPLRFLPLVLLALFLCLPPTGRTQTPNEPAEAWPLEEVVQLLRDSPWAREKFILIATGRMTRYPVLLGRRREPGDLTPERLPAVYLVRWESAEPVAWAFARLADLGENALAEFLARPPPEAVELGADYYLVTVRATEPPPPPARDLFAGFERAELETRAELKTPRGTSAKAARVLRSGFGATAALHFCFPRQVNDSALIAAGDDWVEFSFSGHNNTTLRVKFRKAALPPSAEPPQPWR